MLNSECLACNWELDLRTLSANWSTSASPQVLSRSQLPTILVKSSSTKMATQKSNNRWVLYTSSWLWIALLFIQLIRLADQLKTVFKPPYWLSIYHYWRTVCVATTGHRSRRKEDRWWQECNIQLSLSALNLTPHKYSGLLASPWLQQASPDPQNRAPKTAPIHWWKFVKCC